MLTQKTVTPEPGPIRIMVVEDDQMLLEICRETLGNTCHHVDCVSNLDDARKILLNHPKEPHDLIFLDLNLGQDSNGKELCQELRNPKFKYFNPLCWIVAFTSEKSAEIVYEVLSAGANDFLPKPVRPNDILVKLQVVRFAHARNRVLIQTIQRLSAQLGPQ